MVTNVTEFNLFLILSFLFWPCSNLFNVDFLFGLFFAAEDGGDMFFETSVDFLRTTRLYAAEPKKVELFLTIAFKTTANLTSPRMFAEVTHDKC
jgi:hypothetical protein